ncbi:hypothetical protein KSP40_PGU002296 [Platanthera guangdongensis]|uniref:Uncharacterized protein n=1 Tax=Platanthera guangdongensis TaxID=2320717 RepID=A0ABR2LR96_9ASPA
MLASSPSWIHQRDDTASPGDYAINEVLLRRQHDARSSSQDIIFNGDSAPRNPDINRSTTSEALANTTSFKPPMSPLSFQVLISYLFMADDMDDASHLFPPTRDFLLLSFQFLISYFFVTNGLDGAPNVFIVPNRITHSSLFRLSGI